MKKFLLFTSLFFISTLFFELAGQTKEEFEKIFLQETENPKKEAGSTPTFKNIQSLSYYPDTLPSWFFSTPRTINGTVYAIGVSDPDLTPEEAAEQAVFRAKTMAGIFSKSKFQYFKDIYTSEQTSEQNYNYHQRFDTYFKITSSIKSVDQNFKIINQHFTKYNEAVVLIEYNKPSENSKNAGSIQLSSEATVLYIELQVEEAFEPQAEYELISGIKIPNQQPQTASFKYVTKSNKYYSESNFQGVSMEFPSYFYKYTNPNLPENSEPYTCYRGLWGELSRCLMKQIMQSVENNSVKIKSVGQQYNPEIMNLTREVAIKNARMYLNGIEFGNDAIDFNLEIEDI